MRALLSKLLFQLSWRYRMLSEYLSLYYSFTPVVVYTMGKVASTSVYLSLKKYLGARVYFAHTMDPVFFGEWKAAYTQKGLKVPDLRMGLWLYRKKVRPGAPLKVITLLREPLSRNISDFFERFEFFTAGWEPEKKTDVDALKACFLQDYPHDYPLDWFDKEWNTRLGIDVYAFPFDPEKGYLRFKEGNRELLVLRSDLNDSLKGQLIGEFTGLPSFRLRSKNRASQKPYAALYHRFRSEILFSASFLDSYLEHPFYRHFFTEPERAEIRKRYAQRKSPSL